jgi:hypothetical protein
VGGIIPLRRATSSRYDGRLRQESAEAAPLHERPDIIATRVVWLDPLEGTARELLEKAEGEESRDDAGSLAKAKRFLQRALALGERPMKEIKEEAEAEGIRLITLRRAAKKAVAKRKDKFGGDGGWFWKLY